MVHPPAETAMPYESWKPRGGPISWRVRELIRAVMGLHSTFSEEIWLWRGQSQTNHAALEPGMHSRIRKTKILLADEMNVRWATAQLIAAARENDLDRIDGLRLPDLALLAHLQHHGAATPLLDVTVDPFVGLWMVVHASGNDPTADDGTDGVLFGIRRPEEPRWLVPLDSRPYWKEGVSVIATAIAEGVYWYRAPDISERLRIQRGSFLVGRLAKDDEVTFPLRWASDTDAEWLKKRIEGLGKPGKPVTASTEVIAILVPCAIKAEVRKWLRERAGLTQEVIYPTPWHRPFLEEFCRGYGRDRPIDFRAPG